METAATVLTTSIMKRMKFGVHDKNLAMRKAVGTTMNCGRILQLGISVRDLGCRAVLLPPYDRCRKLNRFRDKIRVRVSGDAVLWAKLMMRLCVGL